MISAIDAPSTSETVARRPGGRSAAVRAAVHAATLELLDEVGYDGLVIPEVARRAGVNRTTVYRRWPDRADLVLDLAESAAVSPQALADTGSFAGDLEAFLVAVASSVRQPAARAVFAVLAATGRDARAVERRDQFWHERFAAAAVVVERAVGRGEVPASTNARELLERAVAPIYFRAILAGQPMGSDEAVSLAHVIARSGVGSA